MAAERANALHLPDLSITNFRGIDHLSIRRLGRVTLLAGRNGVGKTTVLEAVRVFAARGRAGVLQQLLASHDEFATFLDADHDALMSPDYAALFGGRTATPEHPITICTRLGTDEVRITVPTRDDWPTDQRELFADLWAEADGQVFKVSFRDQKKLLFPPLQNPRANWLRHRYAKGMSPYFSDNDEWPAIECRSLGPGLPRNRDLARFWDRVALTDEEDLALESMRLTGNGIERIAVIDDNKERTYGTAGRRVVVKLKDCPKPVPLKSLGDGVTRLFAAGLALANSRNGFLVVDEAENGIHRSVQRDFWRLVLQAARRNDVQVLATTHSQDCVTGFARAIGDIGDAEGVLVRLEKDADRVRAVDYSEEELATIAEQGIEVR